MKNVTNLTHLGLLLSDDSVIFHQELMGGRTRDISREELVEMTVRELVTLIVNGNLYFRHSHAPTTGKLFS